MSLKIRIRRPHVFSPREQAALPEPPAPAPARSFSATLRDCMDDWEVETIPLTQLASQLSIPEAAAEPVAAPAPIDLPRPARPAAPSKLAQAWSWVNRKYAIGAAKRLRIAETLQLGEKRFVALITVEGREFLIGGGASGVSLLAQLSGAPESANTRGRSAEEPL